MTFITKIDTPSTNLIKFNDVTIVDDINAITGKLVVTGNLNMTGSGILQISDQIGFNGTVTGSSPFRVYLNSIFKFI